MTLNITVEDLQLGRYEAQKNVLLRQFVARRAILNRLRRENHPPKYLDSELLRLMVRAAHIDTGIVVVCADRGIGKTTAAKFVLKSCAGGIMFCNCQDESTGGFYWKGVARYLGVPKNVYETDPGWKVLLAESIAAVNELSIPEQKQSGWIDRFLERITSVCGAQQSWQDTNDTDDPPSIESVRVGDELKQRGLLIFDDFNDVHDEDVLFMKSLFPILDALEVLAFVLVRDQNTANRLVNLNGWGRISPLEGICSDASGTKNLRIPLWRMPTWTLAQLTAMVQSQSPETDIVALQIQEDENPFDLLRRAKRLAQGQ